MADELPQNWDTMPLGALCDELTRRRATPLSTIEAIVYCVRERGLPALKEPANLERLSRCDAAARAQINKRIEALLQQQDLPDEPAA